MNEVNLTTQSIMSVSSAASSKGDMREAQDKEKVDKPVELEPIRETQKAEQPVEDERVIAQAITEMNDYVQSVQRDLEFSVDADLGKTVVKVVDMGTGELIRQIPEQHFLDLARNLKADNPLQLFDAMG